VGKEMGSVAILGQIWARNRTFLFGGQICNSVDNHFYCLTLSLFRESNITQLTGCTPSSSSENIDPKMGSVASHNTLGGKFDSKMGSVSRHSVSPVQNPQFQNTDLDSLRPTFSHRGAFTSMSEDGLLADYLKDGDLRGDTYEDLLARMQTAAGDFRMSQPLTDEFASDVHAFTDPSGDFRYLPTFRQQQASPGIQDVLPSSERPGFFSNRMGQQSVPSEQQRLPH
jgi:hypothetical protein